MTFDIKNMKQIGSKQVQLFFGRMQPIHNGHAKILESMHNGVVAIVKGKTTSKNKNKNPLDAEYQKSLVEKINSNVQVLIVENGYLPEIINILREDNKEVSTVFVGSDRIDEYKAQVQRANANLDDDHKIDVTFKEAERITSATIVRDAIRRGDREIFEAHTPEAIWGEWGTLYEALNQDYAPIKSFSEFLKEDVVTTAAVENSEKPMSKIARRKKTEITEDMDIPNLKDCLNKMRHGMPQLTNYDAFVSAVKGAGGTISDVELTPKDLTPTQKNFNEEKVQRLIDAGDLGKPIISSNDNFVVDGHHRWLAAHRKGDKVKCRQVSMSIDEILDLCKDADFIEKKTINENNEGI